MDSGITTTRCVENNRDLIVVGRVHVLVFVQLIEYSIFYNQNGTLYLFRMNNDLCNLMNPFLFIYNGVNSF